MNVDERMFQELDWQNLVSFPNPNCLNRAPQNAVSEQGNFLGLLNKQTKKVKEAQRFTAGKFVCVVDVDVRPLPLRCQDEEMMQRRMGFEGLSYIYRRRWSGSVGKKSQ